MMIRKKNMAAFVHKQCHTIIVWYCSTRHNPWPGAALFVEESSLVFLILAKVILCPVLDTGEKITLEEYVSSVTAGAPFGPPIRFKFLECCIDFYERVVYFPFKSCPPLYGPHIRDGCCVANSSL